MADSEYCNLEGTLIVVSCGKAKIWDRAPEIGAVPARDAYASALFKLCRGYAERKRCEWVILSAKYGFLDPAQLITNYNVAFGKSREAISTDELRRQWVERFTHVRRVVSLASKAYDARLISATGEDVTLETPLKGLGLFQRMAWLKRARIKSS
jgi:hypothetical protein